MLDAKQTLVEEFNRKSKKCDKINKNASERLE